MKKGEKLMLCSNFTFNCPSIEFDGQEVLVRDDYGNACRIAPASWNLLVQKILVGDLKPVES